MGAADIAMRTAAAAIGGYALAAAASALLCLVLPTDRATALYASGQAVLVLWPLAVLYAFGARSAARACRALAAISAACGLCAALAAGLR